MKFLLWRSWFTIPEPPTEQTVTQPEGRAVKMTPQSLVSKKEAAADWLRSAAA